jgi:hypothetical protein
MELFRSLTVRENVSLAAEAIHVGDDPLTQLGVLKGGRRVKSEVAAVTDKLLATTGLESVADRLAGKSRPVRAASWNWPGHWPSDPASTSRKRSIWPTPHPPRRRSRHRHPND